MAIATSWLFYCKQMLKCGLLKVRLYPKKGFYLVAGVGGKAVETGLVICLTNSNKQCCKLEIPSI